MEKVVAFHPNKLNEVISMCYHQDIPFKLEYDPPKLSLIIDNKIKVINNSSDELDVYIISSFGSFGSGWNNTFRTEEGDNSRLDRLLEAMFTL